jgi:hypothetical protein
VGLPKIENAELPHPDEIKKWILVVAVVSIVGVAGVLITYQTFNPWVKWLEGWVRSQEDRLLIVQGENDDLQSRLSQLEKADLSGMVSVTFLANASGLDAHVVEGFLINYGTDTAMNVQVEVIWTLAGNDVETRIIHVGTVTGCSILPLNVIFYFEDDGPNQYQISWT